MIKWILLLIIAVAAIYGAYWLYKNWKDLSSFTSVGAS